MPCDTVTTQSVNLANAIPSILAESLTKSGWTLYETTDARITGYLSGATLEWNKGKGLSMRGYGNTQQQIVDVTRAYSVAAVSWAAQRAGWNIKQTAANQMQATRR